MQITNRTVSFREGSNSISDHTIFEDENGVEYIPQPGPVQKWVKLSDIKKERHDRVRFLQDASKQNNMTPDPAQLAAAYQHTSARQRTVDPSKPLNKISDLLPNG